MKKKLLKKKIHFRAVMLSRKRVSTRDCVCTCVEVIKLESIPVKIKCGKDNKSHKDQREKRDNGA